jgi:hypothetical protein
MSLKKFKDPQPIERPLRILVYGLSKTGKSHLCFTATDVGPLYWQDSEGGASLYPGEHGHGFKVLASKDPRDTIAAIRQSSAMVRDGEPRPIVAVDSMSSVWFQQQEVAKQLGGGRSRIPFHAWGPAKEPLKQLYSTMHVARCHIIITARAKVRYEVNEKGEPTEVGLVPDVERNLAYATDLVVETSVAEMKGKALKPTDFMATVVGTRSASVDGQLPTVPIGRVFRDPKFSDFLDAIVEGALPEPVEDTTLDQAEQPRTWEKLEDWMRSVGMDVEEATVNLAQEFGTGDKDRVGEYYHYLKNRMGDE